MVRYLRRQPERQLPRHRRHRNEAGNVVGLMPHPEHAIDALTGTGTDGLGFFLGLSGIRAAEVRA